jgi:hypothetical protein
VTGPGAKASRAGGPGEEAPALLPSCHAAPSMLGGDVRLGRVIAALAAGVKPGVRADSDQGRG